MTSSKTSFKELTEPVELTKEDIKRIRYSKRKEKITWGVLIAFEAVVGFFSGLIGHQIMVSRIQVYPYASVLLTGGIFSLPKAQKSQILKFLVLTVVISFLGLSIGLVLGSDAVRVRDSTLYGVYFNDE